MAATAVSVTGLLGWKQPARMGVDKKSSPTELFTCFFLHDFSFSRLANRGSKDSLSTFYPPTLGGVLDGFRRRRA